MAIDAVGQVQATMTGIDWVAGKVGTSAVESNRGTDSILINPGGPVTPTTKDLSLAWWMVDTYNSFHTMMNKSENSSQAGCVGWSTR